MLQGHAKHGTFGLGAKLMWDARQFASLKAKELVEQVTDGPKIYLARG